MRQSQISLAMVLTFFCGAMATDAQQPKSIFYMTREPRSVRSFLAHADKIDILSPNWYAVDSSGLLSGGPNPEELGNQGSFRLASARDGGRPGHLQRPEYRYAMQKARILRGS